MIGRNISLVLVSFGLALHAAWAEPAELSAEQAWQRVSDGEMVLIDIRQPEEWRETGIARDAVGIPMLHPEGQAGFVRDLALAVAGQMDRPIVLICRTGNRTGQVRRALEAWGFSRVYHVPEGMLGSRSGPGWIRSGLPVEDCLAC